MARARERARISNMGEYYIRCYPMLGIEHISLILS